MQINEKDDSKSANVLGYLEKRFFFSWVSKWILDVVGEHWTYYTFGNRNKKNTDK